MNRGDRREPIFNDDADRQRLVETPALSPRRSWRRRPPKGRRHNTEGRIQKEENGVPDGATPQEQRAVAIMFDRRGTPNSYQDRALVLNAGCGDGCRPIGDGR